MKRSMAAVCVCATLALVVGCKEETRDTVKESAKAAGKAVKDDAKETAQKLEDATKGALNKGKEAFIDAATKQLDNLDRVIDKLAEKAKSGTEKLRQDVQKLRELSGEIRKKLEKLKTLPAEAWKATAEEILKDLDKLQRAVRAAQEELEK